LVVYIIVSVMHGHTNIRLYCNRQVQREFLITLYILYVGRSYCSAWHRAQIVTFFIVWNIKASLSLCTPVMQIEKWRHTSTYS